MAEELTESLTFWVAVLLIIILGLLMLTLLFLKRMCCDLDWSCCAKPWRKLFIYSTEQCPKLVSQHSSSSSAPSPHPMEVVVDKQGECSSRIIKQQTISTPLSKEPDILISTAITTKASPPNRRNPIFVRAVLPGASYANRHLSHSMDYPRPVISSPKRHRRMKMTVAIPVDQLSQDIRTVEYLDRHSVIY